MNSIKTETTWRNARPPQNWRRVKLGEVAKIQPGYAFKSSEFLTSGDIPVLRIQNVGEGILVNNFTAFLPEEKLDALPRYQVKNGDILISMTANVGSVARVYGTGPYLLNQRVARLDVDEKEIDKDFVFYALRTRDIRENLRSKGHGSVQENISGGDIEAIYLDIPSSVADQKRIADILSAFDDKIEMNNKISAVLEQMAQAIFKEWLLKNQKSKIKNQKLGDLVKIISGYPFSSKLYVNDNKAFGVVTIKNVQDGNFITSCDSFIKEENIPKNMNQECLLNGGDILLSLTGNVGRVCFVYGSKYLLNQRVAKLKPKSEKDRALCYFLFRQTSMQNQLINMAKGSAQPNLSPVETGEIELAVPPREALDKFSVLASPIYERLIKNAVENQKLAALRDLLLPKLMSGEIRV